MTKLKRLANGLTAAAVLVTALFVSVPQTLTKTVAAADKASTPSVTVTKPDKGDGSSTSPFEIDSAGDMWWFAGYVNGTLNNVDDGNGQKHLNACAKLTANFDLQSSDQNPWKSIGGSSDSNAYSGTFDGDGHTIDGFVNNTVGGRDYYGFFMTNKGTVKNLTIHGDLGKGWFIGGFAYNNTGTIDNCTYVGELFGVFGAGGIVGVNSTDGKITRCINKAAVSGSTSLGGIAGTNSAGGEISDCINEGTVIGSNTIGGITGYNYGAIKNCYSVGKVNATSRVDGGISGGVDNDSSITNCYYLKGSVDEGRDGGIEGKDEKGKAEAMSELQFNDGEVTWLLQNAHTDGTVWVQNIKTDGAEIANDDKYPVFATDLTKDKDKVFKVTLYFPDKDTVYGGAYANKGDYPKMPVDPSLSTGYEFAGWFTDEGCTQKFDPDTTTVTGDTKAYGKGTPIEYTISYELNGGTVSGGDNPTKYNIESNDITLKNPTRPGYKFIGWRGTGLTGNTNTTVTIKKGSTGERQYYANFESSNAIGGEIKIGDRNVWGSFSENISFNTYFNSAKDVSITYSNSEVGNVDIKYFISDKVITESELKDLEWKELASGHTFQITQEGKYVIYAMLTDEAGNIEYLSSSGIIIDETAPVISGIEDGKAYCNSQTVTVTDKNLKQVLVNGSRVDPISADGKFTLTTGTNTSNRKVVAEDLAGNTTTYNVIVNPRHSLGEVKIVNEVNNTCTTDGSYDRIGFCELCDIQMFKDTVVTKASGHIFLSGWEEFTSSECGGSGRKRQCVVCKYTEIEYNGNDSHDWEDTPTVDREPNCAREGSKSIHCKKCKAVKEITTIPKTEHKAGAAVKINEVAPTCTSSGSYDSVTSCEVCRTELSREHITVSELGHTPGEKFTDTNSVVKPTCEDPGRHDEVVNCTVCGAEIERKTIVDPAYNHQFGDWKEILSSTGASNQQRSCTVCGYTETKGTDLENHTWSADYITDVQPTCTTEGSKSIKCTVCGLVKESVTLSALGHTEGDTVKQNEVKATCSAQGSYDEVVYCKTCDNEISRKTIMTNTIPHTPGVEVKTNDKPATCESDGSYDLVVYCTVCETEVQRTTVNVPKNGHSFGEWKEVVSASGVANEQRECEVCGFTETQGLDLEDHKWTEDFIIDVMPTCTTDGSKSKHCTVCGLRNESTVIQALGHTPNEPVIENEVEATCTTNGAYDSVVYCTVCEEEISRETIATDLAPHKLTLIEYKAPTENEDGYIEHYKCSVCEKLFADADGTIELTEEDVIIPAGSIESSIVGSVNISGSDISKPVSISVTVGGQEVYAGTFENGEYAVPALNEGHYTVTFAMENCAPRSYTVKTGAEILELDATLKLYGDINGDGNLTTVDVGRVNAHIRQTSTLDEYDFIVANVNYDTLLTTADCGMINAHVKGTKNLW